ncbi:TIGR00730 family Rossman fold protein [Chelatococcus sp. SYSU_G07232]|uniref:Cytokinin riboside 5'-monophosphate phosphoribohydrolase n=1 Tax=Chelatococcus albus TaxID=3047466 RepID=A0ABT7AKG0_9HYPH|nr:TIGR00730 family Rossman fold protein [Chelatococcus sp. SYSU_G07232]MDJ1159861.1 TIGR00730 family Rossman fold protein [Chelatococcus sp. SYSU_G07232]
MSEIRSICVYCGSGSGGDGAFVEAATRLGRAMATDGLRLVYGGGNVGLMGAVARAVLEAGGDVTGIIPEFLTARERLLDGAQETIIVPDMHTRKRMMYERADAFVALPGGVGTLEELVEQLTWAQLGRHRKPILLLSTKGFWKPLLVLLAHMREQGFIRQGFEVSYLVAENVDEVIPMLRAAARRVAHPEAVMPIAERF